jgi:glutathione S-transferase
MMARSYLGKDIREEAMAVLSARYVVGLTMLGNRLQDNEWLAGREFTVTYVMVTFALTTLRYFYLYSVAEYLNILRYLRRIGKR